MDSDSDSGGSHISATPPRNHRRQPPPKINRKPSDSKLTPEPEINLNSSDSAVHIVRRSCSAASSSLEVLRPGFFSTSFASFTKLNRSSLNFDDDEPAPAAERKGEGNYDLRRKINLVGDNATAAPAKKLRKSGSEGNFVRLNLNRGNRKKFINKCKSRRYRKVKINEAASNDNIICNNTDEEYEEEIKNKSTSESESDSLVDQAVIALRNELSDENLLSLLMAVYGQDYSFREGQLEAIKLLLLGKSTMLVLPTGAGKSLCYQIPALVFQGITIVVSPLVALMIDQLKQLPSVLRARAALICSSQRSDEVSETLRRLQEGSMKVLFVSPERFMNVEFFSILSSTSSISLVVVDEAHCISEWSHNFRPSYMRLRASLLHSELNVHCVLAMTATATTKTLQAVMSALDIPSTNLIQKAQLRDNLQLSVSRSQNRMKDLLRLIKSSPFINVKSIIIYCKFQSETDTLSRYLCDNNIHAKSYHSGIPAKDRCRIQELFCSNKIRAVVATVAFGMGLDKGDVGAVIHYSLPQSLEEYVQEIGRAGRDGRLSYCHLFFDDNTYFKLRSLMHSEGVDEYSVSKFLSQVFSNSSNSSGKICSLIKEPASRKFDMKEEVMVTILTQLELGEVQYLHLLPEINVTCTLNFHKTTPGLLAAKDIVVAAILKKSDIKQGQYTFDIPDVANSLGITAVDLSNHLHSLKFDGEITYEVKDPAYCYMILEVPKDFCSLASHLTKWLSEVEICKVWKLDAMFNTAVFTVDVCEKMNGCSDLQHTPCMQKKIVDYFKEEYNINVPSKISQSGPFLRADIKVFLQSNSQAKFTPRAVARIMHGIASPAYPSTTWSRTHFWGRYMHVNFQTVMEAAKEELLTLVGKEVL